MQAPVYLCLLGNDPAPAYLGLKLVERKAGRVAKAVFYSFPEWNEEYRKKRQALFRLLSEKGVPHEERPLEEGLGEAEAREVWVNLTGGAKLWAVRFFGRWRRPGARVFLVEGHRVLEAPRALFLWPREEELSLEGEALTLEEYAKLYLEPLGEAWERVPPPGAFPPRAQAARLPSREGGVFVVHRGLPYWVRPHLGDEAKDMSRKALSAFSGEAKRLGGQLCLPVVPYHRAHLRSRHPREREKVLARWKAWAREYGVFLVDPGRPLEEVMASQTKGKASKKALPLPQEGPLLLALVSEQAVPLYAAHLHARPREVYLLTTPEMESRLRWAEAFFRGKGVRVHRSFVPGPWALKEVRDLLAPVVREALSKGFPMHANLNGGTTAMALGLYLALEEGAQAHYLDGDRLFLLDGGEAEVPWEEGAPEDLLALRGYRLEENHPGARPNPGLLALAEEILERWDEVQASWEASPLVGRFFGLWRKRFGQAFPPERLSGLKGLPLEYAVYSHLNAHLAPRGGRARMGGHLVPLGGNEALAPQSTEVDGVFFYRGALWLVECKPRDEGLRERALLMGELVRSVGGVGARGLMVARRWREAPPPASPNLVYMALEGGEGVPGVYRFPQDLGEVLSRDPAPRRG
ncbi:hypothetical protein SAMN04488243_11349 [Thermus arciformis]|uniref:Uncharacterized protein n=1 Tax=Thermus arciformis TaxID=482827 RepID=A0A1G7GCJ9_9DEIN|nr:hypothetical protein [Thermus arciformis]SDE85856.1 hypothetical protein SAMN04488243_11349 [Thermus arciformis]